MKNFFEVFLPGERVRYIPGAERIGIVLRVEDNGFFRVRWDGGDESSVSGTVLESTYS